MMDLITQIFLSHERWLTYFQHSGSKNLDHYYQNIIISQVDKSSPLCTLQNWPNFHLHPGEIGMKKQIKNLNT